MHYPVITEKHVADRWQVSLKTLRRWRLDGEGPVWHKLFRHVRYHEADVLEFEHSSAQHLMTLLGIKRDFKPEEPKAAQGLDAKAEDNYFTAKEIAEAASLPIHLFRDQVERNRKRVPRLMLVGTSPSPTSGTPGW
ncbi:MAG: helix-turn-helix domain-containing protein [Rhodocyclales bacterium]|nr:helix-turn-helix domain-containing protein [Rhodocyclales bacterium]